MTRRDFGRYKIAEEVGRGAMGVVYRALDPVVGRTVAIKAINTRYLEGVGVKAAEYLERFRREAEVAGRLNHPNIVKIYDLGPDFLVMEFVQGQSLASMLQAKARLHPDRILDVIGQVAEALDYAHRLGIVHRDVKPANIMIQPDGIPKVMDFGLARIESSTLTAAGEILGSASYMAPEVVLGRPADAASDVFSLGVVAYEMMTGYRPFGGASITVIIQNIVRVSPRPAHEINLHLPTEYDGIFERVLAKEPGGRYASAAEFAAALSLRRWQEPGPPAVPTTTQVGALTAPGLRPADAGAATIPPGTRMVLRPGDGDAGDATMLTADADDVGGADAEEETGGATLLAANADELAAVTLPPAREPDEIPAASLEPVEEEETPLASLVVTQAPAATTLSASSTQTQAPGTDIGAIARRAAAGGLGASEVLDGDAATVRMTAPPAPATPSPPASSAPQTPPAPAVPPATPDVRSVPPAPTRKGLPLGLILGATLLVLLGAAGGLSYLAYRWLVQRMASHAPTAPPETTLAAPPTTPVSAAAEPPRTEPPATEPPTTLAEARPVPETMAPATLAPASAALSVTSDPPGARVVIGKKPRGTTPLRLRLPPGRLSVTVEKDGFKPWKKDVSLSADGLALEARLEPQPRETATPKPAPTPAGVRAGDLVPLGPDVTPPKKVSGKTPELPQSASKLKLAGSVLVEYVVDEGGQVNDPKVVESAGTLLDAACLDAVRTWRYEPASTQGVKVKVVQRAKFTFQSR